MKFERNKRVISNKTFYTYFWDWDEKFFDAQNGIYHIKVGTIGKIVCFEIELSLESFYAVSFDNMSVPIVCKGSNLDILSLEFI